MDKTFWYYHFMFFIHFLTMIRACGNVKYGDPTPLLIKA